MKFSIHNEKIMLMSIFQSTHSVRVAADTGTLSPPRRI